MSETDMTPEQEALVEKVARAMYEAYRKELQDAYELAALADVALPRYHQDEWLGNARAAIAVVIEEVAKNLEGQLAAYPLSVFPEPDLQRVHSILEAHGIALDVVSASNMRHAIKVYLGNIRALAAGKE